MGSGRSPAGPAAWRWLRWLPVPVAVGSALAGWITVAAVAGSPAPGHAHEDTYQSGGLVLTVNLAAPAAHDEMTGVTQPSYPADFPMPGQTMPGMQAQDEERLHVEVSLRNPGGTAKPYRLDDFHLVSGAGGRWIPNNDSFAPGMLAPGLALNLDLYFDYPLGHSDLSVSWTPIGGDPVVIPLIVGDAPARPGHGHAPSEAPAPPAHPHGPGEASGHTHGP